MQMPVEFKCSGSFNSWIFQKAGRLSIHLAVTVLD